MSSNANLPNPSPIATRASPRSSAASSDNASALVCAASSAAEPTPLAASYAAASPAAWAWSDVASAEFFVIVF